MITLESTSNKRERFIGGSTEIWLGASGEQDAAMTISNEQYNELLQDERFAEAIESGLVKT